MSDWRPYRDNFLILSRYIAVSHHSRGWFDVGLGVADVDAFTTGQCHHLALALQQRLGGTLLMLYDNRNPTPDLDPVKDRRVMHVALQTPEGFLVDAHGFSRVGDLPNIIIWPCGKDGKIMPITPADVGHMMADGVLTPLRHPDTDDVAGHLAGLAPGYAARLKTLGGDVDTAIGRAHNADKAAQESAVALQWQSVRRLDSGLHICRVPKTDLLAPLFAHVVAQKAWPCLALAPDNTSFFIGSEPAAAHIAGANKGHTMPLGVGPDVPVLWFSDIAPQENVRRTAAVAVAAHRMGGVAEAQIQPLKPFVLGF